MLPKCHRKILVYVPNYLRSIFESDLCQDSEKKKIFILIKGKSPWMYMDCWLPDDCIRHETQRSLLKSMNCKERVAKRKVSKYAVLLFLHCQ